MHFNRKIKISLQAYNESVKSQEKNYMRVDNCEDAVEFPSFGVEQRIPLSTISGGVVW